MEDIPFMNDLEKLQEEYMKLQEHLVAVEMKYQNEISESNDIQQSEFVRGLFNLVVDLYGKDLYSDVVILLEDGRTMKAHRLVLYARSNDWVFTKSDTTTCTIDLADIKYDVATMMIRWVYTDHIDIEHEGESVLVDLLKAADQFHLDSLISRCEKALIPLVNIDNCRTIIQSVQDTSAQVLKGHCFQMVHEADTLDATVVQVDPVDSDEEDQGQLNELTYTCDVCQVTFPSKRKQERHLLKVHRFDCSNCEQKFTRTQVRTYTLHSSGNLTMICRDCAASDSLKSHITLYVNRKHQCDVCGHYFRFAQHLATHKNHHTGEKPFSCDICGHAFTSRSCVIRHMNIHLGTKQHICDVCGRIFNRLFHLKRHNRIHTGEKPYQCTECGKVFRQINTLQVHLRTHSGEKPYQCTNCQKTFSERRSLLKHEKSHLKSDS